MNFEIFEEHLICIYDGVAALSKDLDASVKEVIVEKARQAYFACETEFIDEGKNLQRWLEDKHCVVKNPITDGVLEVRLPRDYEVLYELLVLCKKQNEGDLSEEAFLDFIEGFEIEDDE